MLVYYMDYVAILQTYLWMVLSIIILGKPTVLYWNEIAGCQEKQSQQNWHVVEKVGIIHSTRFSYLIELK